MESVTNSMYYTLPYTAISEAFLQSYAHYEHQNLKPPLVQNFVHTHTYTNLIIYRESDSCISKKQIRSLNIAPSLIKNAKCNNLYAILWYATLLIFIRHTFEKMSS